MTPARSIGKCTAVAIGAVSVRPQEEIIATFSPRAFIEQASRRSHRLCGSPAPA